MAIEFKYKSMSVEERRKKVTDILVGIENKKHVTPLPIFTADSKRSSELNQLSNRDIIAAK